tara:strand:- start:1323 stop:1553 length:231 start_codon:yes stop_codon:yes gene_type:complete
MLGRSRVHNKISKAIQDQIIEEYEDLVILQEMNEPAAIKLLSKEWLMTPMEIHDILVVWKRNQNDIDFTGDLGEIV